MNRVAQSTEPVRKSIVRRTAITEHDGASGARLERAILDDGSLLVLKRFDPAQDLTMHIGPGEVPREIALWREGVLDALPPGIGHAVRDAWLEDGYWMLVMRDLSPTILGWDSRIDRPTARRIFAAAAAMHEAFRGVPIEAVLPFDVRLTVFSARVLEPLRDMGNPLPDWVIHGWERFAELVPTEVADAVFAIHDQPAILSTPLTAACGSTLLHGDLWIPNVALEPDGVFAIDWALATHGPPIFEFVSFMVGCASQVRASREQILDDVRSLTRDHADEESIRLGLLGGLVEMGWNMAWHAAEHPGAASQEELDWWVAAAVHALETVALSGSP